MISINTLKSGDVVYDARKTRMGNTTMRRLGVWPVEIMAVDVGRNCVVAKWNGNPPRTFYARGGKFSWRRTKPEQKRP